MDSIKQGRLATVMSLCASGSTLVCCALPALPVALGAGATLASLVSAVPQLIWLSENKVALFIGAALMLGVAGNMQWRARSAPCPADPALAAACMRTRRASLAIYIASVVIFVTGGFFAFVAPLVT